MGAILSWAVLGLVAGGLAKLIMPGKDPGGCLVTMLIGIAGAFLGGWLGQLLFRTERVVGGLSLQSLALATFGSFVLLVGFRLLMRRREPPV